MHLNRGRFRDNGGCGYLLRPPFFNQPSTAALPSQPTTEAPMTRDTAAIAVPVPGLENTSTEIDGTDTFISNNGVIDDSAGDSSSRDNLEMFASSTRGVSADPSRSNDRSTGDEWESVGSRDFPSRDPTQESLLNENVVVVSEVGSIVAKRGSTSAEKFKHEQQQQQKELLKYSHAHSLSSRLGVGIFSRRLSASQSRSNSSGRNGGGKNGSSSSGQDESRLNQRLNRRHRSLSPFHSWSNKPPTLLMDDVEKANSNDYNDDDDADDNGGSRGRSGSGDEVMSPNVQRGKLKRPKSFSPTVLRATPRPFGSFIGSPSMSSSSSSSRISSNMSRRATRLFRRSNANSVSPKHSHSPSSTPRHDTAALKPEHTSNSPSNTNSRSSSRRRSSEGTLQGAVRAAVASPSSSSFYSHSHGRGRSSSGSASSSSSSSSSSAALNGTILHRSWEPPRSFNVYAGDPKWGSHAAVSDLLFQRNIRSLVQSLVVTRTFFAHTSLLSLPVNLIRCAFMCAF